MNRREFLAGCAAAPVLPSSLVADQGPTDAEVLRRVVEAWYSSWIARLREGSSSRHGLTSLKASDLYEAGCVVSAPVTDALARLHSTRMVVYSTCAFIGWETEASDGGGVVLVGPRGRAIVHEAMGVVASECPDDDVLEAMSEEEHVRAFEDAIGSVIWFAPEGDGHRWARGERFLDPLA